MVIWDRKWYDKLQMDRGVKSQAMTDDVDYNDQRTVPMLWRELVAVGGWGLVVGLVTGVIYLLFNHFVFGSVLCQQSAARCSDASTYAIVVAQVIGVVFGVGLLARRRVYRPLLVVAATLATLWTIAGMTASLAWPWQLVWFGVLFGLSYALFAWLARIRNFVLAAVVIIVVVILLRLVIG